MSIIIEPEILDKIERLEKAGNFSAAVFLRGQNEINLDALSFQSFIPAKYLALLGQSPAFQALQWANDSKRKEERDTQSREFASQLQALRQQQIDQNRLTFKIDGQDINISQGDMRKIMEKRLEELKKRQEALLISGESPEELAQTTSLIEKYVPLMDSMKKGKADAETKAQVQDLIDQDPTLQKYIKQHSMEQAPKVDARRISYAGEHFATDADRSGAAVPSLRDKFAQQVGPNPQSATEEAPTVADKPQQNGDSPAPTPNKSLEKLGL